MGGIEELGENIDVATFEQILEMDDDEDDREFSRSIVFGFFEQAETTFQEMETALYVKTTVMCHITSSPQCMYD